MNNAKDAVEATLDTIVQDLSVFLHPCKCAIDFYRNLKNKQLQRKVERLESFMQNLRDELYSLKNKVNQSFVNQPDCADILEKTINYIINERSEEKRKAFKNIFISSLTAKECNYDRTERFLRMIDQMTELDILILKTLFDPISSNEEHGNKIVNPNKGGTSELNIIYTRVYSARNVLQELISARFEDIDDSIGFLENNRLVNSGFLEHTITTGGNPLRVIENQLTLFGRSL